MPAFIAAIFNLIPNLFPFFAPAKGPATYNTNLLGQVLFCNMFHDNALTYLWAFGSAVHTTLFI
jgi:hypothetical protein